MAKNDLNRPSNQSATDLPTFMYGTAWKEDHTTALTLAALRSGFRAIDTANQRKHYYEAGVGAGIQQFLRESPVQRDQLFIQTKFTYQRGQDHRLPYDPNATLATQVQQSFASSCEHLGVETIDSYVLHGPENGFSLSENDLIVWRAMEQLVQKQKIRYLGVSNVNLEQLETLFANAIVKPTFVQNRCFATSRWDKKIRLFCTKHAIKYQGFSLLTANLPHLHAEPIRNLMQRMALTMPQVVFSFAIQVGMLPLTGTTNEEHMRQDLCARSGLLTKDDTELIENIAYQ